MDLTAVCATCLLGASVHPKAREVTEVLCLRQVEPLNGGGATNFRSGAANLFPGSPRNLVAPPFCRFSCGFFCGSALVTRISGSTCAERLEFSGSALVAPHIRGSTLVALH